jgi:hypothetical protein
MRRVSSSTITPFIRFDEDAPFGVPEYSEPARGERPALRFRFDIASEQREESR